jgi:hypothetical protein
METRTSIRSSPRSSWGRPKLNGYSMLLGLTFWHPQSHALHAPNVPVSAQP